MDVIVTVEARYLGTPDGAVWTQAMFAHSFWERYLSVFDSVRVVARVKKVDAVPAGWRRADGPGVTFAPVPYYVGPWGYIRNLRHVRRVLTGIAREPAAVILRVPSAIATSLAGLLDKSGRPYGLEVVGDPHDVFAPGVVRHPFRPFFRWWFSDQLRRQCRRAEAVAYVTRNTLQQRYPARAGALTASYSSIELPEEALRTSPRAYSTSIAGRGDGPARLLLIGSLEQLYKAPDIAILAVRKLCANGTDVHLTIVGDGRFRQPLTRLVEEKGLQDRVTFLGQLASGQPVRVELDRADLFILPSRTEGLPRVLIEAMARGLPCIASSIGGIPELLPSEDMVAPDNVASLATKIAEVLHDPQRMERMSRRNVALAAEFSDDRLQTRRREFLSHLRDITEDWLRRTQRTSIDSACAATAGGRSW